MTRRWLAYLMLGAIVLAAAASSAPAHARDGTGRRDRRVLIISVPGLSWADVGDEPLANLRELLDDSAVANLATRVTGTVSAPAEAYLTLGSGTRAVAPAALGGLSFDGLEPFGTGTAADEYARQQGTALEGDMATLSWVPLGKANDASDFGAEIGSLGQALEDASIERGVVANADALDPLVPTEPTHREAVLAMADATGAVSCGSVGPDLLRTDPGAPYGVRLDDAAVLAQFDRCSTPGSVVLVEASDLRRAAAFRSRATESQAEAVWARALESTDHLVGSLARRVDPQRDAIVVVAPSTSPDAGLGVLGIRASEFGPGWLSSGNTHQRGYVVLTDLAPTLARLVGAALDDDGIEGRAVDVHRSGATGTDRRTDMAIDEAAALFRDRMLDPVVRALVAAVSVLALAMAVVAWQRWDRWLPVLEAAALVLLAFPTMTYLTALFPFHDWGAGPYWLFTVLSSAGAAAIAWALRRWWLAPLVFTYGILVLAVTASVVALGSRLQLSTVFGDSPIVAGRFSGINNVTFALFVVAGIVLACAVMQLLPRRGRVPMVALLGTILLVDVAPMWGADVGGALAGLPALALVAIGLGRWKVRWRTMALLALATVALVIVLGLLDLSRDSADRSHLGRLFERIGSDGSSGLTTVVDRKLDANLRSLTASTWRYVFLPVLLAAGLIAWKARARATMVARAFPALVAGSPGLAVTAVLGYAVNDSGIAVPGAMVAALVPALVYLTCRLGAGRSTDANLPVSRAAPEARP